MGYVTDTTVVRLSEYEALKLLNGDTQREAVMALLEQAFTGTPQTSRNVTVQMLLRMSYDHQLAALERYQSAVMSGSVGGRPETVPIRQVKELTEKGLSQQQIADKLGCSVSTVRRKQRKLGYIGDDQPDGENTSNPVITAQNLPKPVITPVITAQNLNTDTDTDTATDTATDEDAGKDKYTDIDTDASSCGTAARAVKAKPHVWEDERPANDHPYVAKALEQLQLPTPDIEDDLPF